MELIYREAEVEGFLFVFLILKDHQTTRNPNPGTVELLYREAEVERFRNAEFPWPDVVDVPGDEKVKKGVQQQHQHGVEQREVIVHCRRVGEVGPFSTITLA